MSTYVASRKSLVALMAVMCVLLSRHATSARSEPEPGPGQVAGSACGPSMQGVDRLKADLGLDNALANRANTMAAAARQAGQPPPANQVQSLTEDSLDGLKDAGDQLARLFQAAGAPIVPGCGAMQNTVDKLKAGLPLQNEWIKRSEDQLRAAEEGVRGSQEELKGMALKAAVDLVKNQLQLISDLKVMARAAKSAEGRNKLLDRIKLIEKATEKIEEADKLGKAGIEGNQLGSAIAQNRAQLVDFIKFVNESGISDELGLKAAELAGPVGVAVVQTFTVARDVLYASFQGKMSAEEAAAHRQNLQAMRSAKADVETRIYELSTDLAKPPCTPTPRPADRLGVAKDPEPPATAATSGTTTPATRPKGSGGKVLGGLLVAGAAGLGTYYYLDKTLNKVDGGGGNGSVKATFVSMSTITCTFNAGGLISSCTGSITFDISGTLAAGTGLRFQFDAGPGGNRTTTSNPAGNVTFTISGGTGSQTCPTLRTGTVLQTASQTSIGSFSSLPTSVTCR